MAFIKNTGCIESDLNGFTGILVNGFVSVGISIITLVLVAVIDREFRNNMMSLRKYLKPSEWK